LTHTAVSTFLICLRSLQWYFEYHSPLNHHSLSSQSIVIMLLYMKVG
jgi:hypothetical protein